MKVKLVAWFAIGYESSATIFASGKVLEGMGPSQREPHTPPQQTLGKIRDSWGVSDDECGAGLPDNTPAWLYEDGQVESNAFVVVEVTLA